MNFQMRNYWGLVNLMHYLLRCEKMFGKYIMKKTQQKRRGGKTQKRRGGTKGEVMPRYNRTGRSKSYRSSINVFQAVKNQKIREILPSISEKYKVFDNTITYKLPGAFKPHRYLLKEEETEMYNKYLESMTKDKKNLDDSIQKWKKFVDDWRKEIDDNTESTASRRLSRKIVKGHH